MRTFIYPAVVKHHAATDYVISFPDLPEVLTGGKTEEEALDLAADALEEAVLARMALGEPIPDGRQVRAGEVPVPLGPTTSARLVLAEKMREQNVSNTALAGKLGRTEGSVRRILDGATGVKIDTVLEALRALGVRATLSIFPWP